MTDLHRQTATAPRETPPGGVPMPDTVRALIERRKP